MTRKAHAVDLHSRQAAMFEERYQRLRESPYSSTFTYGRKKIAERMDEELLDLPLGARALDVGCGTGYDVHRLRERGLEVTGVEPAPDMRARARENNPGVQIVDGDIERLPFPDGSFDFACAIEVIRYLADPALGVAELARVVKPGGKAFVTGAPRWSLSGYSLLNRLTGRVKVPTFVKVEQSFLTAAEAEALFRGAGFSDVEVHGLFLGPWHGVGRVSGLLLSKLLRVYEPIDDWVSDRPLVRDLTNHLVIVARK
jgi:SAM-dependent methyltransferase